MCQLVSIKNNLGQEIKVAEIKRDYIENIIKAASLCDEIDRIYLFGSSTETRCKDDSDVDIAVFGKLIKSKMYKHASYRRFRESIYSFIKEGQFQDYDIIYFKSGIQGNADIVKSALEGQVIYSRG